MDLRLYDTLTREKRSFVPLDPDNVRMYVCGPTVYDFAHIGNARPVIVFDVLFRLLRHRYGERHVTYVRNITDVDDKINDRAARDFPGLPLNEAIRKVTEKTAQQFEADVAALGCLPPTFEPRATDFVLPRADGKTDMVTLIKQLIARAAMPMKQAAKFCSIHSRCRIMARCQAASLMSNCPVRVLPSTPTRKIPLTSYCGSSRQTTSQAGRVRGAGDGRAGTSNARP
jgi:hypothetical protein